MTEDIMNTRWSDRAGIVLGAGACLAALTLHAYPLLYPYLFDDDFAILRDSWTWQAATDNLWRPWNEHAMPLGRLTAWGVVQAAGRPTNLPLVAALQGPLAVLAGMGLVYLFVRRELHHRFYGLAAMILFGVTLKYNEAVFWYAASFAVLALDTMLLALLAAQRWRQTGRWYFLPLSAFWAFLAPSWFASGILAGAFCSLYLLPGKPGKGINFWKHLATASVPFLGSVAFLATSLPRTFQHIQHADHFQGQTALGVFDPLGGLELTGRTLVDNLILGINAFGQACPRLLVPVVLAGLALAGWGWWRQGVRAGGSSRLLLLGMALLVLSYWVNYSFRTAWPYEGMMIRWTRYNLFPFLGLILFVCGGLPGRQGSLFQLEPSGRLSGGQVRGLSILAGLLFLLQFPLGLLGHLRQDPDVSRQMASLRRIEDADDRCQAHGIGATTARQALGRFEIPYSGEPPRINGWDLLRGSPLPQEWTIDEAQRLLHAEAGTVSRPDP
jgi:hypothetical protein